MPNTPSTLEQRLDQLHATVRANAAWQRLAVAARFLLALAFIPTGIVKMLGRPFTIMGTETLVGQFFDVMWRTGGYWRFIGTTQVVASLLLLTPRTTALGAFLFLPIIANIFAITIALHFQGTPYITGPMLLACVFLLCWEYPRWKGLLFITPSVVHGTWWPSNISALERWSVAVGASAGFVLLLATRGLVPASVVAPSLGVGGIAGVVLAGVWLRLLWLPQR